MVRRLAKRLLAVWLATTREARTEGRRWYARARRYAKRLAKLHGVTTSTAAGVISALSPRLQWLVNTRAAHKLLDGQDVPGVFMQNLVKAQRILAGERPLSVLSGPKTRAFYRAIMGHDDAVVDVWVARAAGVQDAPTEREYEAVSKALRMAAATVRVPTPTFQATVWVAVRGRP